MDLRLQRDTLLTELALLQGIVERRTTIPILSHLLLEARGDRLQLAATDLDVSLSTWAQAEVSGEGSIAIQAKKFTEIVRALGEAEVQLVVEEGQTLAILAGRSRFRIRGLDAENFPTLPKVETDVVVEVPLPAMQRMIAKVIFAISTEESRFQLNGALFRVKDGSLELVATDGHRLALVESAAGDGGVLVHGAQEGVLVPRKALQELLRFVGEEAVAYRRSEHHLSFRLGKRELTCRILEGTFPDYERVIAKNNDKQPVLERQPFQQAVQRVALLTGERSRGVVLQFTPEQLVISAANPDLGEAVEQLPCTYDGDELRLGLNPDYLGQFLTAVETPQVRLELKDAESQCVGYPVDGEALRYLCVIMPMHV
ncbi:MAG TPA: DNA polymerase III subunit beta [Thermoanaerobaculia bacterium]|nr:DNA polymerase III subunit beta [Thermoanaerobaculia bacterium]